MLKRLWEGWKRIAKKIARFNSLVICTVLYFLLLPFVALPFRISKNPLRLNGPADFIDRERREASLDEATRQG
jgi:hypothetical protein